MDFHPFPQPFRSNNGVPPAAMALGSIQAIHTGIMRTDHSCISPMAFIENLGKRAARIKPIAILPDMALLILAVRKSLIHIAICCDPLTHDLVPALLPEVRTTI